MGEMRRVERRRAGPTMAQVKRTARALQASGVQIGEARVMADGAVHLGAMNGIALVGPKADLDAELTAWRERRV